MLGAISTHGVIPAQAGIQVLGDQHTSSAGMAFSMDSGLRRNDPVGGLKSVRRTSPLRAGQVGQAELDLLAALVVIDGEAAGEVEGGVGFAQ